MEWLQTLDANLFHLFNGTLSNRAFDVLMPWFSGNAAFFPVVLLAAVLLVWKGGVRGRLCVLLLLVILPLGDSFICNTIKHAVGRPRPFVDLPDVRLLVGRGPSNAMPSSHAANWAAAAFIAFVYYRRSRWFMLPLAAIVGFSRIYNGVHYPADVLAGFILGAGYAAGSIWSLNALWQRFGKKWFPLWWEKLPSLLLEVRSPKSEARSSQSAINAHWLRLGYLLIGVLLLARLGYLASGIIELSEDEAYQWLW
jgi:membrane-associated phospholipid phosphatase